MEGTPTEGPYNVAFRHVCRSGSAAQPIYNLIARHKIEATIDDWRLPETAREGREGMQRDA